MKAKRFIAVFPGVFLVFCVVSSLAAQSTALTPVPRDQTEWWTARQAANVARMEKGDIDLLMIGDSITHGWERPNRGKVVWENYYANRKTVNLGFSGDRTEHVLWRLEHLPLDKIQPKVAVLMIGTNNIGQKQKNTPEETADGIKAIVEKLEKQYPSLKILVLNIFPRGEKPDDPLRKLVEEINARLPDLLKDKPNVTLLDIGSVFLDGNRNLPKEIMADFLHPGTYGYELWAAAMEPTLKSLLGEKNPAVQPADRLGEDWWKKRHEANVERMSKGDVGFLMIGDSITHSWDGRKELVEKHFAAFKPINLGFGGDRTQHVLWRLDHLPLDKIQPKVAMVMIGTNNIGARTNTPWMVAAGIKAIVDRLRQQYPELRIVVLNVFPRGEKKEDRLRHYVAEINMAAAKMLAGMDGVEMVDLNAAFLNEDGSISADDKMTGDFVHLTDKGYEVWAERIAPVIQAKFGELDTSKRQNIPAPR